MLEIIKQILINLMDTLYKPFGYVLLTSILLMFLYLYIKEMGMKKVVNKWIEEFKNSCEFRRFFLLAFNTLYILFCTLFNRSVWSNPLSDVIGVWGLYDKNGNLTTESIENVVLFVPFIMLVFWCFREKIIDSTVKFLVVMKKSAIIVFVFSFVIELLQLLLRVGTFQLSDLFYNTLGGLIGGLIYWIAYKVTRRKNKKKNINENQEN